MIQEYIQTIHGHGNKVLVHIGEEVYYGQIIALNGSKNTGYAYPHHHVNFSANTDFGVYPFQNY